MDRVIGMELQEGRARDEDLAAQRLRHRRAADERCERGGLLRQCRPVTPGRESRRTA